MTALGVWLALAVLGAPASTQRLVVRATGGTSAELTAWEYADGVWQKALPPMPARLGYKGFARHGEKREGDGRTPRGRFALGTSFGTAERVETRMPYRRAGDGDYWVDDPESADYNRWVQGRPAARSVERMKRADGQYDLGVVIEYNTEPVVKGKGSAIFLHVWKGAKTPTAGCVAVARESMEALLRWLEPGKRPEIWLGDAP